MKTLENKFYKPIIIETRDKENENNARILQEFSSPKKEVKEQSITESPKIKINAEITIKQNVKLSRILNNNTSFEININSLRSICWKGIPENNPKNHSLSWKYLLNYYPLNTKDNTKLMLKNRQKYVDTRMIFESILNNPKESMNENELKTYNNITKDVLRTNQMFPLFQINLLQKIMTRILYLWSIKHKDYEYMQGYSDLLSLFIVIFINEYINFENIDDVLAIQEDNLYSFINDDDLNKMESDAYFCFTEMINRINFKNNDSDDINKRVDNMLIKMEKILKVIDFDLYSFLQDNGIKIIHFAYRWISCYLFREFNYRAIVRLFDTYFSEGQQFNDFHLFVCICLLLNFKDKIYKIKNFQDIIIYLQNIPTKQWDVDQIEVLIAKSYQLSCLYSNVISN